VRLPADMNSIHSLYSLCLKENCKILYCSIFDYHCYYVYFYIFIISFFRGIVCLLFRFACDNDMHNVCFVERTILRPARSDAGRLCDVMSRDHVQSDRDETFVL